MDLTLSKFKSIAVSAQINKAIETPAFVPPECLDPVNGRIRRGLVKSWLRDNGGVAANMKLLHDIYMQWVSRDEYLILNPVAFLSDRVFKTREEKAAFIDAKSLDPAALFVGLPSVYLLAAKKGNRIYAKRVKGRIKSIRANSLLRISNRCRQSNGLLITLTCKQDMTLEQAWGNISKQWESFLKAIRKHFGCGVKGLALFKSLEATRTGYPHLHACLIFKGVDFPFLSRKGKLRLDRGKARGADAFAFIKKEWFRVAGAFSDIEVMGIGEQGLNASTTGPRSKKDFFHVVKYLLKDISAIKQGGKCSSKRINTLALQWLFGLKAFTVSKLFPIISRKAWVENYMLSDLITRLHNPPLMLHDPRCCLVFVFAGTCGVPPPGGFVVE